MLADTFSVSTKSTIMICENKCFMTVPKATNILRGEQLCVKNMSLCNEKKKHLMHFLSLKPQH